MLPKKLLAGISFAVCILLPVAAFSDINIVLKNGRTIAAENCEEKGGEFVCSRAGGSFNIQKGEVAAIEGIPAGKTAPVDETLTEGPSDESNQGNPRAEKEGGGQSEQNVGAPRAELEKRLGEITQRKRELRKKRAKLLKDRQQIEADLDKAPDWMTEQQFASLSGRVTDIDERIKKFKEEASRLDVEEKKITDQLEGRSGDPVKKQHRD